MNFKEDIKKKSSFIPYFSEKQKGNKVINVESYDRKYVYYSIKVHEYYGNRFHIL